MAGLAHWLRDYAGALGKIKLALKAAAIAFEQTHAREDFRAAESWAKRSGAGKTWPKLREALRLWDALARKLVAFFGLPWPIEGNA